MNTKSCEPDKKPSFVLKEFLAQKDKSTNDAVVSLRPNMYALAKSDDKEAQLKKDTIGTSLAASLAAPLLRLFPLNTNVLFAVLMLVPADI